MRWLLEVLTQQYLFYLISDNSVPFQSDVLMPTVFGQPQTQAAAPPVQNTMVPVTGNLDMSLANVMADLTTGAKYECFVALIELYSNIKD